MQDHDDEDQHSASGGIAHRVHAQIDQQIARRLRELRKARGMTLEDVAARTGGIYFKSRISNYEQGLRRIGIAEAKILAAALDVPTAELLCLDNETPVLTDPEMRLIADFRMLPERDQLMYARRIAALALVYANPLPDDLEEAIKSHPPK